MKQNRIEHRKRGKLLASLAFCIISMLAIGVYLGFDRLRDLYLEQCIITDMAEQVTITSGKMVKPDVIAENLGLKVGANTALIDFEEKRRLMLQRIHTLREVIVTRRLPNRIFVTAEERTPAAKMGLHGSTRITGRVVDPEGMVFVCQRGTQLLPTIYEPQPPGTASGQRLKNRARAALTLIKTCREPKFSELNVLDVDTSRTDFLIMTLGNYSTVKIAWEGMDDPTSQSRSDLEARLDNLLKAIRTQVGTGAKSWNATMPNAIFADTQEQH